MAGLSTYLALKRDDVEVEKSVLQVNQKTLNGQIKTKNFQA